MADLNETTLNEFKGATQDASNALYQMLKLWDDEFEDFLHSNQNFLDTYKETFGASFDEWWNQFHTFLGVVEGLRLPTKTYAVELSVTVPAEYNPEDIENYVVGSLTHGEFPHTLPRQDNNYEFGIGAIKEVK